VNYYASQKNGGIMFRINSTLSPAVQSLRTPIAQFGNRTVSHSGIRAMSTSIENLEGFLKEAKQSMKERNLSKAITTFQKIIELGKKFDGKDEKVNRLKSRTYYYWTQALIAERAPDSKIVDVLGKSIARNPKNTYAKALKWNLSQPYEAIVRADIIRSFAPKPEQPSKNPLDL
jgi:hypothetical protein